MKTVIFFVLLIITSITFSQNVSPQFSELKGMEDPQGNTHLFYRIYTSYENDPIYSSSNSIYHFDLSAEIDTQFLSTRSYSDPIYNFTYWISDLKFWNNNPAEFIFSGGSVMGTYYEGNAFVERFDGYNNSFGYFWGTANYIDIASSNDSLLYLGINTDGGFGVLGSTDGGRSWDSLNISFQFLSLDPYSENIFFVEDEERRLFRTTDFGSTFNLVDPEFLPDTRFFYDPDGLHIYRKGYQKLIVSDNIGEQFSWQTVFTASSNDQFYFNHDISVSGSIFIAEGKNIFHSSDFGNNFNLYKTFERRLIGIYKKPDSEILYAATKYKIYEITPDSLNIVKRLPIPQQFFDWYSLEIGNKWVYNNYREPFNPPGPKEFIGISTMEITGDTILNNLKKYYKLKNEPFYWENNPGLIRSDSLEGKLYIYFPQDSSEKVYEDFLAEVGDTIWIDSLEYKVLISEEPFNVWGLNTLKRMVDYEFSFRSYELVKNIGMYFYGFRDFFSFYTSELKGCVINGVVYGDTTVVSVEDEKPNLPFEFSLSQNYPNPFNPKTKIRFTISISLQSPPYQGGEAKHGWFVQLKIYDILGNEIATLVNEQKTAGEYEVEFDATGLPSGIYYYQLKAGNSIQIRKMILLK